MLNVGVDASMLTAERSGVGNYVFNLLSEYLLIKGDTRITLFSNQELAADCRQLGEAVENIGPPVRKGPLWMSSGLYPWLKKKRINVFWGGNGYVPLLVPRGVRRLLTVHDMVSHEAPQTMLPVSLMTRRVFQTLAIAQADRIITVSNSTSADLARHSRRRSDLVLPPLLDTRYGPVTAHAIAATREKYRLPDLFLLSVGTLEPRKNLLRVLRAHAELRHRGLNLPQLLIVGRLGWMEGDIRAEIGQMEAEGHVSYLGYVPQEDMPTLYAAAAALLFLPVYEGYGMPAREALLCGTPVIASDIPALREATEGNALFVGHGQQSICDALQLWSQGRLMPPPARLQADESARRHAAFAFSLELDRLK